MDFEALPTNPPLPRINELPAQTIDQIAAGEILERPAQLLKELLENSLDAGAKHLSIDVWKGGRDLRIRDDGHGILSEDLALAVKRFATSKLRNFEDLLSVRSFGFRGEALASLLSVSRLWIRSRPQVQEKGRELRGEFGEIQGICEIEMTPGTEIEVRDLFQNVPARLKFLKSEASELAQIKAVLKALALARPEIQLILRVEGELAESYSPASALQRVRTVLKSELVFHVHSESDLWQGDFYFSAPELRQRTSKNMWFFVNSRWVQDRSLQAAVSEAYRNFLMHGDFPSVAIFIQAAAGSVDVNVHPQKNQIKFQDPSGVFRWVRHSLLTEIEKAPWNQRGIYREPSPNSQQSRLDLKSEDSQPMAKDSLGLSISHLGAAQLREPRLPDFPDQFHYHRKAEASSQLESSSTVLNQFESALVEDENPSARGYWASRDLIGQANLTYLVCQDPEGLLLIDQHAAHERILFESWVEAFSRGHIQVQRFLIPLVLDLSAEKIEALLQQKPSLEQAGIEVEALGPSSLGVLSAPELMRDSALGQSLEKMAEGLLEKSGSSCVEEKLRDLFASLACHSAIRAGQSLSRLEMQTLLKQMDQHPTSSHCPHGRPVVVRLGWGEIERRFGRLV